MKTGLGKESIKNYLERDRKWTGNNQFGPVYSHAGRLQTQNINLLSKSFSFKKFRDYNRLIPVDIRFWIGTNAN